MPNELVGVLLTVISTQMGIIGGFFSCPSTDQFFASVR